MSSCEGNKTPEIHHGKFAYGLLDPSKDPEFQFSENPKVVQQTDKTYHKKPGRKPLTSIPDSKRKAQILTAQRAFRERKKYYLEELENKVKTCEVSHDNTISSLQKELLELKERLAQLEAENQALKNIEPVLDSTFVAERDYDFHSNNGFSVSTTANSLEAFNNTQINYGFIPHPALNGPTISGQREVMMPMPGMSVPQYEGFSIAEPYEPLSLIGDDTSQVSILGSDRSNSPGFDLLSSPLSDFTLMPIEIPEAREYLETELEQQLYPLDATTSSHSSILNPVKPPATIQAQEPLHCCEKPVETLTNGFQEVSEVVRGCNYETPCIPKSQDEAALCESLTCVAIGVPPTTVSTDRLVLELEESAVQLDGAPMDSTSRRKYLSARDVWEKFSNQSEFSHLSVDCLCKQLKSKVKILHGGEKRHVILAEDEVSAAFERLHVSTTTQ
ncbi:DNA-binding transcription factor yap1 [Basidiobolus ranarum]|uniref:DNA-binding transcription factor yap1 n=1 Tax=Basidiobolus ranarum TaxID=34480 RepID=A0ABR2WM56_9FUNG